MKERGAVTARRDTGRPHSTRRESKRQDSRRLEKANTDAGRAAVQIFAANEHMNEVLIERLDPAVWRASPPGKVRTIAAIFTHVHNVRTKWVRLTAPHLKVPRQLTARIARRSRRVRDWPRAPFAVRRCWLRRSMAGAALRCFTGTAGPRPWPVGMEMLCYMISHEAHHRGQVSMLAHQLGFPLPPGVMSGLWNWEKLWKECGARGAPGSGL